MMIRRVRKPRKLKQIKRENWCTRQYDPRGTYTDFGAGFLTYIGNQPNFFTPTIMIIFGIVLLWADGFSGSVVMGLGLGFIAMGVCGYKEACDKSTDVIKKTNYATKIGWKKLP